MRSFARIIAVMNWTTMDTPAGHLLAFYHTSTGWQRIHFLLRAVITATESDIWTPCLKEWLIDQTCLQTTLKYDFQLTHHSSKRDEKAQRLKNSVYIWTVFLVCIWTQTVMSTVTGMSTATNTSRNCSWFTGRHTISFSNICCFRCTVTVNMFIS